MRRETLNLMGNKMCEGIKSKIMLSLFSLIFIMSINGICADVQTNLPSGRVKQGTEIIITQDYGENNKVHYTLDGSEPTSASETYTQPIIIDKKITDLQYAVFNKNGKKISKTEEAIFVLESEVNIGASFSQAKENINVNNRGAANLFDGDYNYNFGKIWQIGSPFGSYNMIAKYDEPISVDTALIHFRLNKPVYAVDIDIQYKDESGNWVTAAAVDVDRWFTGSTVTAHDKSTQQYGVLGLRFNSFSSKEIRLIMPQNYGIIGMWEFELFHS